MKKNNTVYNVWICEENLFYINDILWLKFIKCKSIKICLNEQSRM